MKTCPICGTQNTDQRLTCIRCGSEINQKQPGHDPSWNSKGQPNQWRREVKAEIALLVVLALLVVAVLIGVAIHFGVFTTGF